MKRSALALLVIALPTACIAGDATPASVVDIKSKETFAVVWDRLQNSGFKGVHEGLDWAALKTKHQPEIEAAADIRQLRKEINDLLEDLKASHFALIPAEAMPESGEAPPPGLADTGLRFALAGEQMLVERVLPGSSAEKAGIRAGWSVDGIDGSDIAAALKATVELDDNARRKGETFLLSHANKQAMGIPVDTRLALRLRDAAGTDDAAAHRLPPHRPRSCRRLHAALRFQPVGDAGLRGAVRRPARASHLRRRGAGLARQQRRPDPQPHRRQRPVRREADLARHHDPR
jgi:hypothetical protein